LTLAWSFVNAHEDLGRHSPPKPARVSLIENDPPTDSFGPSTNKLVYARISHPRNEDACRAKSILAGIAAGGGMARGAGHASSTW